MLGHIRAAEQPQQRRRGHEHLEIEDQRRQKGIDAQITVVLGEEIQKYETENRVQKSGQCDEGLDFHVAFGLFRISVIDKDQQRPGHKTQDTAAQISQNFYKPQPHSQLYSSRRHERFCLLEMTAILTNVIKTFEKPACRTPLSTDRTNQITIKSTSLLQMVIWHHRSSDTDVPYSCAYRFPYPFYSLKCTSIRHP